MKETEFILLRHKKKKNIIWWSEFLNIERERQKDTWSITSYTLVLMVQGNVFIMQYSDHWKGQLKLVLIIKQYHALSNIWKWLVIG